MASGYSKEGEEAVSEKMSKMKGEDRPQAQKVAIAMSEARRHGFKVPPALVTKEKKSQKTKEPKGY